MTLVFGDGGWSKRKAVVVVRTYPSPARKGVEVSCTAAITEQGEWLRLFPIPWRLLGKDQQFHKYESIESNMKKATSDVRPESYNVDLDALKVLSAPLSTAEHWKARKALLDRLRRPSMEAIKAEQAESGSPTLGFFKPKRIKRLLIEADPDGPDWTPAQRAKLQQENQQGKLWNDAHPPLEELEKIPYTFSYVFDCDDPNCHNGHTMSCTDWEMAQSYRKWRAEYGDNWEDAFRNRYEREMIERFDTHFFVGTIHIHPSTWIIVGLFYPLPSSSSEAEPLMLFG